MTEKGTRTTTVRVPEPVPVEPMRLPIMPVKEPDRVPARKEEVRRGAHRSL